MREKKWTFRRVPLKDAFKRERNAMANTAYTSMAQEGSGIRVLRHGAYAIVEQNLTTVLRMSCHTDFVTSIDFESQTI